MRFKGFLLGLAVGLVFGAEDYGAKSVYETFKGKVGSKEGIRQNFERPLTEETPMENIAGTERFSGQVRCPSRSDAVEIYFVPLGGGDHRVIVKEDLDLDGTYEYVFDTDSLGIRVSGVCNAGIVSCDPGSWSNCRYYFWDVSPEGYVSLVETDNTALLGGCFCANSSCGVDALVEETMDMVGGGVAQAIMRAREDLGVSPSEADLGSYRLTLRVQQAQGCGSGGYGEEDVRALAQYYEAQVPPPSMDYVLTNPEVQQSEDSPYYLVNQAVNLQVNGQSMGVPSEISCDIRKDVSVYTTDMYEDCTDTWVDSNGEVWCIEQRYDVNKGGSHCNGWGCRDCSPLAQGGGWVECGEAVNDGGGWSYNCTTDLCVVLDEVNDVVVSLWYDWGPIVVDVDEWGTYEYWSNNFFFKLGSLISSETYVCGTDPDNGSDITCTRETYKLLCRDTLKATVTLHKEQKWAIRIANSKRSGDRGGFWVWVWENDGTYGRGSEGEGWCEDEEFFRVFGSADEEGETHTLGGLQVVHGWGENHEYPPNFGHIWILKSQVYKGDVVSLSESSTCPTDSECVVKNEWICDNRGENCVQTVSDGVRTGAEVLPFCYTTNTQIGNYTVCAYGDRIEVRGDTQIYDQTYTGEEMWFWIKREYECPPSGIDVDLSRTEAVISETSYDAGTGKLFYTDFRCDGGTCTPIRSDEAQVGTPDACPVATCTVQGAEEDRSVFVDRTNRAQTTGGTMTTPYTVKTCEKDRNGNWVCPLGSGEVLIEDCRCEQGLNSFGFAASVSVLQAVVDSSKDLICSTVSP